MALNLGTAGSMKTSTTLRDEKTIPEGRKNMFKQVQKQACQRKRKLYETLDVGSPWSKIKVSPTFSDARENITNRTILIPESSSSGQSTR
jgi:hypothetical protein